MLAVFTSSVIAILAALFCIWLLRPVSVRIGLVDHPGGRKHHTHSVPLIGGIAVFFGFFFALLSLDLSLYGYRALIAGSALLLIIGVVDDFRELGSTLRLVGHIAVALCLAIWGQQQVTHLGNLFFFGDIYLHLLAIPFTVIVVVGFLNAMNMVDGQDGLVGGVALGQVLLLLYLSWTAGRHADMDLLIVLACVLLIFLCFNMPLPWRKQATIFMGDSGSTVVAFFIAWFAISAGEDIHLKPVTLLWILGFPIFDFVQVSLIRLHKKQSLLHASRDHLHHVLHVAGLDVSISTVMLSLLAFALGLLGLLFNRFHMPEGMQLLAWLFALCVYLWLVKLVRDTNS